MKSPDCAISPFSSPVYLSQLIQTRTQGQTFASPARCDLLGMPVQVEGLVSYYAGIKTEGTNRARFWPQRPRHSESRIHLWPEPERENPQENVPASDPGWLSLKTYMYVNLYI